MSRRVRIQELSDRDILDIMKSNITDLDSYEVEEAYGEIINTIQISLNDQAISVPRTEELIEILENRPAIDLIRFLCGEHILIELNRIIQNQASTHFLEADEYEEEK